MPTLGLALLALYGLLAVAVRMLAQVRRTGSTGFTALRGVSGPAERIAGLLLVCAFVLSVAGPVLQLADTVDPVQALDGDVASVIGAVLTCVGMMVTVIAQFAMGNAWRIGLDHCEQTELVTSGPFALARNPIFAAMIPSFIGIALLAPNAVTIAGAAVLMVALELHTRLVEEPHLLAAHGERYAVYAAQVGRFLPGIGRMRMKRERL